MFFVPVKVLPQPLIVAVTGLLANLSGTTTVSPSDLKLRVQFLLLNEPPLILHKVLLKGFVEGDELSTFRPTFP